MNMAAERIDGTKLQIGQFVDFVKLEKPIDIRPSTDCCWYALLTEPNRVFTVTANLTLRRVSFYVPTFLKAAKLPMRQHLSGAPHPDVTHPIFPGIVFIPEMSDEMLTRAMTAYGVLPVHPPLMRFGESIAVIRPDAMRDIQAIETVEREKFFAERSAREQDLEKEAERKAKLEACKAGRAGSKIDPWFKTGEQVRIAVGEALAGYGGTIQDIDDHGRITLLTAIMKREVRVHLWQDQVERF
jgi:transcription antitermination factor NusG